MILAWTEVLREPTIKSLNKFVKKKAFERMALLDPSMSFSFYSDLRNLLLEMPNQKFYINFRTPCLQIFEDVTDMVGDYCTLGQTPPVGQIVPHHFVDEDSLIKSVAWGLLFPHLAPGGPSFSYYADNMFMDTFRGPEGGPLVHMKTIPISKLLKDVEFRRAALSSLAFIFKRKGLSLEEAIARSSKINAFCDVLDSLERVDSQPFYLTVNFDVFTSYFLNNPDMFEFHKA